MNPTGRPLRGGRRGGAPSAACLALTAGLLLPTAAVATEGPLPGTWGHRGSIVSIVWTGNTLLARYLIPDETLRAAGIRPGDLLFAGRME